MRCPACQLELSPGLRFCGSCGARLELSCAECGRANPFESRFCGGCGKALAASELARPAPVRSGEGERRQLTILFCDLVGSTELAARLDPEEWHELVRALQASASAVVERYGGHVAQHLGDGLLAYFGWPRAQGDDAERAVRAALALAQPEAPRDPRLVLRVGVHTGSVLLADVGRAGHVETLALGEAPNVAARVQGLAKGGEVVITRSTLRLVTGLFVVTERGECVLRGVSQPIQLYSVLRSLGTRRSAQRGATRFVGREAERRVLTDRLDLACRGQGQVVVLTGEPGIGKSRLAQTLRDDEQRSFTWFEAGASPHHTSTPFYAISEILEQAFAAGEAGAPDDRGSRLRRGLESVGIHSAETHALLAPLLDVPTGTASTAARTPDGIHQGQLDALERLVLAAAELQPVVILLEDLQWADPSTLELTMRLAECAARAPVLLLCTARTEFRVPWPLRAHHTQLTLSRLATRQTYELVAQVAGGATLHKEVADAVVARSDGVPIFAEELTKAALEVGARGAREIPDTLAGSLLARLDRLGPAARDVALVASVLGREFSRPLLRAVLGIGESELDGALRKLVDAELAWVRGAEPDPIYTFKHALVCDAAYGSLLRSRRRELHGRVARALSERFPATGASRPDVLAHHFSEAGALGPAAENWLRAGEQAFARGANGEALGHAERALVLVAQLPGRAERDALELQLQLLRVRALTFAKGPATPEAVDALDSAVALSSRSQDSFQQGFLLAGLFAQVSSREGAAAAGPIAERLVEVAERAGVRPIQAWGHFSRGMSRYFAGDVELAYGSFQRALGLCDGEPPMRVPIDPRVALLPYLALTAWYLGRADEARTRSREATELAQRLGQPAERAWAESFAGLLWLILREPEAAIEHAEAALAACAEEPNAMQEAMTTSLRGAALTELGDVATGLALACAGVERFRAIGERISLESTLGFLADAHANAGKEREALRILEEAEGIVPGEELHRSDTLRRRAALLERVGAPPEEAEAAHRGAIAWARKKGALALELRGALGYARFLHDHDRSAEARALLTPLIDCLSEGGDTRDLRDATELLAQLEGRDRVGT